jgi:four helix bundle protein
LREIGAGSVFELVSQAFIARRQGFVPEENFQIIYSSAHEIGRMLSGLRASLRQ